MFREPTFQRRGITKVEIAIAVMVIGMLVALVLPAINMSRDGQGYGKASCRNKMKQIALGLNTYFEINKRFPNLYFQNGVEEDLGDRDPVLVSESYSWLVQLLPYMEEKPLYDAIKLKSNDFTADPKAILVTVPSMGDQPLNKLELEFLRCPSFSGNTAGNTNYVATAATKQQLLTVGKDQPTLADGVIIPRSAKNKWAGVKPEDIRDGHSKTILLTESREEKRSNWYHHQQTLVCGFLPGDTSVQNNDPTTGIPRIESAGDKSEKWIFNTKNGNRTAMNVEFYNENANDPLRRTWGPSSEHVGDVIIFGMADGSVQDIHISLDPKLFYAGISREGGEPYSVTTE